MHRRRLPLLIAMLVVAVTASTLAARGETPAPFGRLAIPAGVVAALASHHGLLADQTDDYIKTQMDRFHLPGLSLVVVRDGELVKAAAYGLSDRERRTPAAPETVYKIGSV